jgi:hypothetical protein
MMNLNQPGDRQSLEIKFKGDRNYLHGTDILTALENDIEDLNNLSFRLHKIVTHGLEAIVLPVDGIKNRDLAGLLLSGTKEPRHQIGLIENDARVVEERYKYDDKNVVAEALFQGDTAEMCNAISFNFVEQLVALQKALLQRNIDQLDTKWYFTQLDINHLPKKFNVLRLTVSQRLGIRLVKSKIVVDGNPLGTIAFSGVKV